MKLTFSIYRYDSVVRERPHFDTYNLEYNKGMTLLDVVLLVQQKLDPTLAFRYECRQGICGTCGLTYNGKPVLSCSTPVDPSLDKQVIEPLANFPVEKDLIVNIMPVLERYKKIRPYLDKIHAVMLTKHDADTSKPFRKCIECGCCIAGSPSVAKDPQGMLDPMALVKIARFMTDPRDGVERKILASSAGSLSYGGDEVKHLAALCPRGVPIDQALEIVKK